MSTITIPANAIGRVREGAVRALSDCAEGIDHAGADRDAEHRVRRDLEGVWRLLDAIGWGGSDAQRLDSLPVWPKSSSAPLAKIPQTTC
jgi:hypothetical protein